MYLRRKRHDPRTTRPSHAGVVPFPFGRGFRRTSARGWRFAGVTMDGFIDMLDDYMVWYRDKRIKTESGMSIMDRRRRLGLVA